MWKKYIIKIITIIGAFLLGVVLRQGLSSKIITEKLLEKSVITNINYVYTFGINEIMAVLLFTGIVYICFYIKYIESKTSLVEINKTFFKIIYIEMLIFAFTIGTCLENGLNKRDVLLILGITVLVLEVIFSIEKSYKVEESNEGNRKKLYESRESLLGRLKTYLSKMDAVAITGVWGIGKTVFLNEFFYRDKNGGEAEKKYEKIYIDTSIFTENKKIIEKIERDLNNILEKHGILKIKDKLLEGIVENNSWCKSVLSFFKLELEDKNQNLEKKIEELKTKGKYVVLCLDNFERISDKDRIIKLLAIIGERIPKGIKRIYLYDEEYMEKLFSEKKDLKGFREYFNKYIEHSFEIKEVEVDEILEGSSVLKEFINKIKDRINFSNKNLNSKKDSLNTQLEAKLINAKKNSMNLNKEEVKKEEDEIKQEFHLKINNIEKLLKISLKFKSLLFVPRYLEQLRNFAGKMDGENKLYELEWKIISDFFSDISAQKLKETSFDDIYNVLDEDEIDEKTIFLRDLFFNGNTGNNYDRLKVYKNEKEDNYEKEIKEIEKNIQGKLIEGLDLIKIRYSNNKRIEEYNEFLENGFSNLDSKYIIYNGEELDKLIIHFKDEIDKVNCFFLKKMALDENGRYKYRKKKVSAIDYREYIIRIYLQHNKNIENLLQFILSRKEIEEYTENYYNFEQILKEKLEVNSLEDIIKKLKEKVEKKLDGQLDEEKEKLIKKLNLISLSAVEDIKKSLNFAEQILALPVEAKSEKKKKIIDEEYFQNNTRENVLREVEEGYSENGKEIELYFQGDMGREKIIINKDNIVENIGELRKNLNKEVDEEKKEAKICLLIEFIKFQENLKHTQKVIADL